MPIRDQILAEFDPEMATTRRVLAAVTDAVAAYRPHAKSWTMGELAQHVANVPHWLQLAMTRDSYDFAPVGAEPAKAPAFTTVAATLEYFDGNVAAARAALAAADDAAFAGIWRLLVGGDREVLARPRAEVVRSFCLNHLYHHRGQLTVYLRLCDVPVPEVYGPTADSARPS